MVILSRLLCVIGWHVPVSEETVTWMHNHSFYVTDRRVYCAHCFYPFEHHVTVESEENIEDGRRACLSTDPLLCGTSTDVYPGDIVEMSMGGSVRRASHGAHISVSREKVSAGGLVLVRPLADAGTDQEPTYELSGSLKQMAGG